MENCGVGAAVPRTVLGTAFARACDGSATDAVSSAAGGCSAEAASVAPVVGTMRTPARKATREERKTDMVLLKQSGRCPEGRFANAA